MTRCNDKKLGKSASGLNIIIPSVLSLLLFVFFESSVNADVLVYKWSVTGTEYDAPTAASPKTLYTTKQLGYLAFDYDAATDVFSNEKLVTYWISPANKKKYYTNEDFLFGIADFQRIQTTVSGKTTEYLTISAFWGGMLGEYYSGKTSLLPGAKLGTPSSIQMATVLKGWSSWDKLFTDGSTSQGGGTVNLSIDYTWTSYANVNDLNSVQTATLIVAQIASKGYNNEAPKCVVNTPADGEVDITGGKIDGTVIGGEKPMDGTFGELLVHSDNTGFNTVFQSSAAMTGDTLFVLPPDSGTAGQVLTTNGNGILSWTSKGAGSATTASNIGTAGFGVFDNKTGDDLQFRNIAAASNKVTVTLDSANIKVDVDESKINRGNLTGTQTAATISDFQTAVTQNPNVQLSKLNGTVPPTKDDDSVAGYSVGSKWIDTTHSRNYICIAASAGAAVWQLNTANLSSGGVASNVSYVNTNNSSWSSK